MNNHSQDNRRPEEIEDEIERTRAEVSSTIDAIQSKLTPGQLMDQALSYARTSLPADFSANLGQTVRNNPVPVSLIGIGIAWLMMSGQQQGRMHGAVGTSGYQDGYGMGHAADTQEGTLHRARSKASEMGHRISDTTSSVAGRARDLAHGTRARAEELGHRSQERYHRTRDHFSQMADEQPLMVGALGLALGTLLGALLPATRREDELMGGMRDGLLEKARETARERAPAVRESAHRAAEAARQEFERTSHQETGKASANGAGRGEYFHASSTASDLGAGSSDRHFF